MNTRSDDAIRALNTFINNLKAMIMALELRVKHNHKNYVHLQRMMIDLHLREMMVVVELCRISDDLTSITVYLQKMLVVLGLLGICNRNCLHF